MSKEKPAHKSKATQAQEKAEASKPITAEEQEAVDKIKRFSQRYKSANWKSASKRR